MNLTDKMIKTLMQVGYGVTYRTVIGSNFRAAFYDENDEIADMRSLNALAKRGLVYGFTTSGAPCVSKARLTEKGWKMFEEVKEREEE